MAVSPNRTTVFVTGYSFSVGDVVVDYARTAYDATTGRQLWVACYGGSYKTSGVNATALAVSPNGNTVHVTGHTCGSGTYADYATVACSAAAGRRLWVSRYNGASNSVADVYISR